MKLTLNQKIFWSILVLGFILRICIIFLPLDILFSRWGSDDLFYYSQIAGNFAENGFFSFDGVIPTNGFQPLFEFLLVPFGSLMKNNVTASLVTVLLIVSALSILAAIQVKKLSDELKLDERFGLLASALFLFHPKILSVTFNGTEAALSFLMIVLSFRAFLWVKNGTRLVISSLIFAGLVLTRLDFSIILFLLFIFGMIQRHNFWQWFKVLILPTLFFISWLAINFYYFDSILPSSGSAKSIHFQSYEVNYFNSWLSTFSTAMMSESSWSFIVLLFTILGLAQITFNRKKTEIQIAIFLFIVSAVIGILPIISMGAFRDWYLVPHFIFIIYLITHGILFILKKFNRPTLILSLIVIGLWTEAHFSQRNNDGYKLTSVFNEFEELVPQGKNIAAFNSGIAGCVIQNHRLINIDGVVNNDILPFFKGKNLEDYFEQNNIEYIVDYEVSIDFFLNNFSDISQYEVIKSSELTQQKMVLIQIPNKND